MYILGVSCFYHDSAAVLLADGELDRGGAEERFQPHQERFRLSASGHRLIACARRAFRRASLDYVVFYEKPLLKFDRILRQQSEHLPQSWMVFREAMIAWFNEKLWVKAILQDNPARSGQRPLPLCRASSLSHAASAFFASPFEDAAMLTVDGVGEWTTTTIGKATATWRGRRPRIASTYSGTALPALARSALLRLHRLPGLPRSTTANTR